MKKTMILETLAALVFATAQAHAAPLSLDNAVITATYQGSGAKVLGLDDQFQGNPGGNVSHIDGTVQTEFLTSDYLFGFDFSPAGLVTVYANSSIPALAPGDRGYTFTFDFANTLPAAIASFTLQDGSMIGGMPALTVINGHSIGLDLSQLTWNGDFADFTAQLASADASGGATVPEPASLALVLSGACGLAASRKRKRA